MNPLLLILNPRRIPACITAFNALHIDKAWLTGYRERDLEAVIRDLIETTDYTHYTAISDDCIVTQAALDAVLNLATSHPVTTGYCTLDRTSLFVNLTSRPLIDEQPSIDSYHFITDDTIRKTTAPVRTYFTGMSLTTMTRHLWQTFPFTTYGTAHSPGNASDYHLSYRLGQANIPIWATPQGRVQHLKEQWNGADTHPDHRILVGNIVAQVTREPKGGGS